MTKPPALVLLGYSGVGKDTLAGLLQYHQPRTTVHKFSAFTKALVSSALDVPKSYLEDKVWRTTHNVGSPYELSSLLTPLDLLVLLFQATELNTPEGTALKLANLEFTLSEALQAPAPVFTDVRRLIELNAVQEHFSPTVVFLEREGVASGAADGNLIKLRQYAHATLSIPAHERPQVSVQRLINLLGGLYIWTSTTTATLQSLPAS